MKTFRQYLVESEKTFDYRIKIVGELPTEFEREFKEHLKKFDPVSVSAVKTTPVQSAPTGFPAYPNERVNIIDVVCRYPATPPQIAQMARLLGLDQDRMLINELHWSEGMDTELAGIEDHNRDLLTSDYPTNSTEQKRLKKDYAADAHDKEVVRNSASQAHWTVAGGRTPPAETTNDLPQGVKSPISNIKRPPRPATGRQPQGN